MVNRAGFNLGQLDNFLLPEPLPAQNEMIAATSLTLTGTVTITANAFALFGRHIYVTIEGQGKTVEYRATNMYDAKSFIERILAAEFSGCEVISEGDTIVPFVYHHEGD